MEYVGNDCTFDPRVEGSDHQPYAQPGNYIKGAGSYPSSLGCSWRLDEVQADALTKYHAA